MRSIWKGAVSFGLVSIPVKLYSATEERNIAFHQVRRSDGSRIRYQRVAAADGEEVPFAEIAKGLELPGGETVVLEDADFASLPLATARTIEVLEFVPLEQVDPIYFAKSYFLEPERTGTKPYVLLREALTRSGKVAIVKVALRQREQLATLRVRGGVFVLETMLWPDEVRAPDFPFLADDVPVRDQELAMAQSLIDTLAGDFDPSRYRDDYRAALEAVIEAKIAGSEVVTPPGEAPREAAVSDLMSVLQASVDAARRARLPDGRPPATGASSDTSPDGSPDGRPTAASTPKKRRPAAARPATTDRATTDQATAKKTAAKRTTTTKAPTTKAPDTKAPDTKAPDTKARRSG
jgi:DNA end-binding protein Ku